MLAKVRNLLCKDWQVHVRHIYREAKRAMDCLANVGHSLNLGVCFYMSLPSCLGAILRDDVVGVALPWMIL